MREVCTEGEHQSRSMLLEWFELQLLVCQPLRPWTRLSLDTCTLAQKHKLVKLTSFVAPMVLMRLHFHDTLCFNALAGEI